MKKKKNDFKNMKIEDLKKEILSLTDKIRMIKFASEGSKSKNVKELSFLKKDIARILTVINAKNQ